MRVTRHQDKADRLGWLVLRAGSNEKLCFIPDADRVGSVKDTINRLFDYYYCQSCQSPLLEGEVNECGLCEAARVMALMRLREELS